MPTQAMTVGSKPSHQLTTTAARFEYWQLWDTSLRSGIAGDEVAAMRQDLERDVQRAEAAAESRERAGDRTAAIAAQVDAGLARTYLGNLADAASDLAQATVSARRHGTGWEQGYAAFGLGTLMRRRGELARGIASFEEACGAFGRCGDGRARAHTLVRLSDAALAASDPGGARLHLLTALELFRRAGDRFGMLIALRGPAAEVVGAARSDRPDQALEELQVLTRREREVAELIGTGLTNRQIAERMTIAERTVDTHVQRILAKLNRTSRVQVAVLVTTSRPPAA
jgi:non-specific serine/threonine protein kinase